MDPTDPDSQHCFKLNCGLFSIIVRKVRVYEGCSKHNRPKLFKYLNLQFQESYDE
jgi:hypothetical protein